MLSSRTSWIALPAVLGALWLAAASAPVASAAVQLYASPNGSGAFCASASPCSLTQAVKNAGNGDEVILASGDYPLASPGLSAVAITIHGIAGRPRPRLLLDGSTLKLTSATLRYVEVDQAPSSLVDTIDASSSSLDQVVVKGSDMPLYPAVKTVNSTVRNSIVVAPGSDGVALQTPAFGGFASGTYRNVTAIANKNYGVAIQALAGGVGDYATILARNVIAIGGFGGASLAARTFGGPNATAKIAVDHSNWLGGLTQGGGTSIVDNGGNQSSAPQFVAGGDYRQAAGSPTIDAGLSEAIDGDFDVNGDPREIGRIDIGADEFVVAPGASTGAASAVTDHSATLSGSVNTNGAPTGYHFEFGATTAYGGTTATTAAGSGDAVAVAAPIGALSPATTYHYRIVATNAGGTHKGADHTFATAAPPPTSTPPPATAFAGVKLVSSKLTFGGRFVAVRLRCPAGTAGRCSGRTRLTARHRASGARSATTVRLGRRSFSIAAGTQAKVKVRVSRAGRRLLARVRRLRAKDTNAAHDGAGHYKTTVSAVTIRRHR